MYKGKRLKNDRISKLSKYKAVLVSLLLIFSIAASGTLALIVTHAGPVENTFTLAEITPGIHEEFDGKIKNNVKIQNDSEVDAYIRATVIFNWLKADGELSGIPPVEITDYTIKWTPGTDNKWIKGSDGHYYFTEKVSSGAFTDVLLTECVPIPKDGYTFSVDILTQAIQSEPDEAVIEAWGCYNGGCVQSVNNGILEIKQ